ncbi:MAG: hypothetical protein ACE5JA_06575, partial [bacterium]
LPPGTPSTPLYDVCLSGHTCAWVAAGNGLVIRTEDGGKSWRTFDVLSFSDHFQSIWAMDAERAWTCSDNSAGIAKTEDGGARWQTYEPFPTSYPLPELDPGQHYSRVAAALWAASFDTAYVALSEGRIGRTTDGGETWAVLSVAPGNVWFRDVWSKNRHVWAVGTSGEIRYSDTKGESWKREHGGAIYDFNDIDMVDDLSGYGWAVGTNGTIARRVPRAFPDLHFEENPSSQFVDIIWDINPESPVDSFELLRNFENRHDGQFGYLATLDFLNGLGRYVYTDFHEYGGPHEYHYWVKAFYNDDESELEGPLAVPAHGSTIPGFPPSPGDVSADRTPHGVLLTWGPTGPHIYRVYRSQIVSGPYNYIGETSQSYYLDSEVDEAATYFYLLRSVGGELTSPDSPLASVGPQGESYDVTTGIDPLGTYYDVKNRIAYFSWTPVRDFLLGGYWVSLNDYASKRELRNVSALSRNWYGFRYPLVLPSTTKLQYGVLPMDRVARVGRWWDYMLPVGACNAAQAEATAGNNALRLVEKDGRLHLVYSDGVAGDVSIYYTSSGDGGLFWSEPMELGRGTSPALASNSSGLYAVWLDEGWKRAFCARKAGDDWQVQSIFESDDWMSPPSLVVDEENGFLATVMKDSVCWGDFPLHYPGEATWHRISDIVGSITSLRASVDLDLRGMLHVCYSSNDGEIYYWSSLMNPLPTNISNSPNEWSRFPSLDVDGLVVRVVWEEQDASDWAVKCWQMFDVPDTSLWDLTCVVECGPGNSSLKPTIQGNRVLWMRERDEPGGQVSFEIYGSEFRHDSSFTWEDGENYSEILWAPSRHPQLLVTGERLYGVWTEGVSPHNWIRFEERIVSDKNVVFHKVGGLLESQITLSREGYLWYGDRVYMKVDYSNSALEYGIDGLEPDSSYAIGVGFYQESDSLLRQVVYVDGEVLGVREVPFACLSYMEETVPHSITCDGTVVVRIQNPDGGIGVASYISVSYDGLGGSGPQNALVEHSTCNPATTVRAFPSPFRHSTTLELLNFDPLIHHVVSVYDVTGRIVDKLPLPRGTATWDVDYIPAGV